MSINGKYDLQERMINFSVSIIELVRKLSESKEARYFGGQILRSGSAPALIYAEAQAAESRKDFVHKLKLCQKVLRETSVNLRIMQLTKIASTSEIELVSKGCEELNAILFTSIKTASNQLSSQS